MAIATVSPTTSEELERFEPHDEQAIDRALDGAVHAFAAWRDRPFAERASLLRAAAANLDREAEGYARTITVEMGKTLGEARAEIAKCALCCRYFADHGERFLEPAPMSSTASESYVEFPPLGVVLAVMPWNFPFWQLFRFAAPALMAGNAAILKHASNVPRSALAIERVFREAGFPDGLFRALLVPGERAEALIDDDRIAAVTLTGSEEVGRRVAARAGRALKKQVLELGGSDPFVVLGDADLDEAVRVAARARFQNAGQSCIAAKRFIVDQRVYEEFASRFGAIANGWRVGDPLDEATQMGPMARRDLREALDAQVRSSIARGARVVAGGRPLEGPGSFYAPTVLDGVTPEMSVFAEETFGPVAAIVRAKDDEEAIALANRTRFGLGASVWTRDVERARRLAPRIEAGAVFVNGMVASEPRLPFGGVKRSGYGRELSVFGIREFVNVQTVWIGPARGAPIGGE